MRLTATLFLIAVAIVALFLLVFSALGFGVGIRVAGNIFAEETSGLLRPAYLIPLIFAAVVGLDLLRRSGRGAA